MSSTGTSDAGSGAAETSFGSTRAGLHRICAHVLGRRRYVVSGRFGLRAGPGGIVTPAFGDGPEVLRVAGSHLIRETGATSSRTALTGSTLSSLAAFAEVDLEEPFSAGADTPALGDVDAPLEFEPDALVVIADWFALAWCVLDEVLTTLPATAESGTTQLWPEHFDAATTVTWPPVEPVNIGFSPGDAFSDEPYAYVGPWSSERPGDPSFWNAPFGAVLYRSAVVATGDPAGACRRFLLEGVRRTTVSG
jgi:hypothetical protein